MAGAKALLISGLLLIQSGRRVAARGALEIKMQKMGRMEQVKEN
ncbi:hypothetical protein ACFLVX_00530 [Chloroflexota bacterium]